MKWWTFLEKDPAYDLWLRGIFSFILRMVIGTNMPSIAPCPALVIDYEQIHSSFRTYALVSSIALPKTFFCLLLRPDCEKKPFVRLRKCKVIKRIRLPLASFSVAY